MWAPTAAASPPLDPPGESRWSRGFRVSPKRRFPVWIASPNSGQFAFPRRTAPAALRRSTAVEPQGDAKSRKIRLPAVARTSRVAMRSLTVNGTPASGPGSTPRAVASSIDLACSIARSSRRVTIAFKIGLLELDLLNMGGQYLDGADLATFDTRCNLDCRPIDWRSVGAVSGCPHHRPQQPRDTASRESSPGIYPLASSHAIALTGDPLELGIRRGSPANRTLRPTRGSRFVNPSMI